MKSFALAGLASVALARPFSFPLGNGFPNLDAAALERLHDEAGGTLPNGPLPTGLTADLITSFQLIAANEIFEVAYFTELYQNVTNKVPGYECTDADRDFVAGALYRIRAQEEFHAIGANAILKANNATTVGPCKYDFPVSDFQSAIALANTFTDVVLGVLPQVQLQSSGTPAGNGIIPLVGSIEEQEAQQVGWFRTLQGKYPSAAPFLTTATPQYALSAIKGFLVPGSCPAVYNTILSEVKSFPALAVTSPPVRHSKQKASFAVQGPIDASTQAIAYISGQLLPVVVPITNVKTAGGKTTFDAEFPADMDNFSDGLNIAAVVAKGTYSSATAVTAATVYGPGLIEYN